MTILIWCSSQMAYRRNFRFSSRGAWQLILRHGISQFQPRLFRKSPWNVPWQFAVTRVQSNTKAIRNLEITGTFCSCEPLSLSSQIWAVQDEACETMRSQGHKWINWTCCGLWYGAVLEASALCRVETVHYPVSIWVNNRGQRPFRRVFPFREFAYTHSVLWFWKGYKDHIWTGQGIFARTRFYVCATGLRP